MNTDILTWEKKQYIYVKKLEARRGCTIFCQGCNSAVSTLTQFLGVGHKKRMELCSACTRDVLEANGIKEGGR